MVEAVQRYSNSELAILCSLHRIIREGAFMMKNYDIVTTRGWKNYCISPMPGSLRKRASRAISR